MKDLQTKKSEKLIPGVQIDGQDVYMNMGASNLMKAAGFAGQLDENNVDQLDKLAGMLFTEESYKLVSMLDMDDFLTVIDLAQEILTEQEKSVTQRFRAE